MSMEGRSGGEKGGGDRSDGATVDVSPGNVNRKAFSNRLHALGAVQFGEFTLKDGSTSPVYCDLRLLISDAEAMWAAGRIYAELLSGLAYDRIAAIPYAGLPLGTAAAMAAGRPMIFPRKAAKSYGAGQSIEGHFSAGETVVVLDDLVSSGLSKLEAIAPLEAAGLIVRDIVVLVDRRSKGADDLERAGYRLHAAYRLEDIAADLAAAGHIDAQERRAIEEFLGGE